MSSPLDAFFKLGEKVTKGDPNRQADFIYYMVWILFSAFVFMFITNVIKFAITKDISYVTWILTGFAITGIQYFTLKGMYDMKRLRLKPTITKEESGLDSVDDMMKTFDKDKNKKGKKEGLKSDVRK